MKSLHIKRPFSFPLWNVYFKLKEQFILFALVIIGLIFRTINAIYTPLWRDEIYIFFTSRDNSLWKLITQQHWDTAHPPLHSIFLHFWQMISFQPLWLRLPSLIASFFILYLIPILAVKITQKYKQFPFIFLFLFSLSHTQISLNMVARPYPFVSLLVIISLIIFLTMIENKKGDNKLLYQFVITNYLAIQTDYSTGWLFVSYFVFFLIYYFLNRKNTHQVHYIFKGLFFSALVSLSVLPLLLGNLKNSLKLEAHLADKFTITDTYIHTNENVYILFDKQINSLTYLDNKFIPIATRRLKTNPFPENKIWIGLNISPLSFLKINRLSVYSFNKINKDGLKQTIFLNKEISPTFDEINKYSQKKYIVFPNKNSVSIINFNLFNWYAPFLDKSVSINTRYMLIGASFNSIYLNDPDGINIYGKKDKPNKPWWYGIRRITVYSYDGGYNSYYLNGESSTEESLLQHSGFFDKGREDIFFFSGLPSNKYEMYVIIVGLSIIILSLLSLFHQVIKLRSTSLLLIFILFFIPLIGAYRLGLFLARGLYISTLPIVVGLSFCFNNIFQFCKKIFLKANIVVISIFILIYVILFLSSFPYLYYVDPPYDMFRIIKVVRNSSKNEKLFILENSSAYIPLIRYSLLFMQNKKIYVSTLDDYIKILKIPSTKQRVYDTIFFIQFGDSQFINGSRFSLLSKSLDCRLVITKIPYIFFAECK